MTPLVEGLHSLPVAGGTTDHDDGHATPPQRVCERRSRRRRVQKAETMRLQVAKLEQFALVVRVAPDPDAVWDAFLDDDTKRLRGTLRKLDAVTREAQRLVQEKTRTQRLLTEHELARRIIVRHVEAIKDADARDPRVHRWRLLAKQHFRPITMDECLATITTAVSGINNFEARPDQISTGMSFMGWRDTRLALSKASRLEFRFDKTYKGFDVDFHIKMMRQIYSDADTYTGISRGRQARVSIKILQRLARTACVIHFTKSLPGMSFTTHHLYLLACVETEDGGAIQLICPIEDVDFQAAVATPTNVWTTSSYWMRWQILDHTKPRSSTDYRAGVLNSNTI